MALDRDAPDQLPPSHRDTVAPSENTAESAAESAAKPAPRCARNHD